MEIGTTKRMLVAGLLAAALLVGPAGLSVTTGETGSWLSPVPRASNAYARAVDDKDKDKDEEPETTVAPGGGMTDTDRRTRRPGITTVAPGGITDTAERTGRPRTTNPHPVLTGGSADVTVTAGSTGDGPADQAECDRWAEAINVVIGGLEEAVDTGNQQAIGELADSLESTENRAMDRGCFIVY